VSWPARTRGTRARSSGSPPRRPRPHNWDKIPTVTHRDEFWHRKYAEDEAGRPVAVPAGAAEDVGDPRGDNDDGVDEHIHMPDASYWPLVMVLGLVPLMYGLNFASWPLIALGLLWAIVGMYGWIIEPLAEGDDDDPLDAPNAAATTGAVTH
jgi:cytochrome c oxidase subunit I